MPMLHTKLAIWRKLMGGGVGCSVRDRESRKYIGFSGRLKLFVM